MTGLLTTDKQVAAHRLEHLAPEVLKARMQPGGHYLLNLPPALGKTTAMVNLINSPGFFDRIDRVAWVAGRRDLLEQTAKRLDLEIPYKVYPDLATALCNGPGQDPRLEQLIGRGLTRAADSIVCRPCPHLRECPFQKRRRPEGFRKAKVAFLTDQLFALRPDILLDWGFGGRSLIVLDEAKGADQGFVRTFTRKQIEADLRALERANLSDANPDVAALLDGFLSVPPVMPSYPVSDKVVTELSVGMQVAGTEDLDFKHVTPLANLYARDPLWHEGDTFAVMQYPKLPGTVVVLGGFLDPAFLAWRYGLSAKGAT